MPKITTFLTYNKQASSAPILQEYQTGSCVLDATFPWT
jgi:hypothetical protein